VFDLVDRVLQLLVEHAAVGDDNHAVVDFPVFRIMEAREPV
jgi:hypothetical protein